MKRYQPTLRYDCQYCGAVLHVPESQGWPREVLHYEWNGDVGIAIPVWAQAPHQSDAPLPIGCRVVPGPPSAAGNEELLRPVDHQMRQPWTMRFLTGCAGLRRGV